MRQRLELHTCTRGSGALQVGRLCCDEGQRVWRREEGLMEGKGGHAVVDSASTFAPMEKNHLWLSPKVSPRRRRARIRGEAPCLHAVSGQQLKISLLIGRKTHKVFHRRELAQLVAPISVTPLCLRTLFLPALLCLSRPAT